jgi:hypothetical protein
MANFAITNGSTSGGGTQQPTATAYVGAILGMTAATSPHRIKIYDVLIGTNGTPADNFVEWDISRVTTSSSAAGTILAATVLDSADSAVSTICTVNSSAFGTITTGSNVFYIGVNQRASYRWVAAPGSELVSPATSSNGFQLRCRSAAYGGTATGTILAQEQ